MKGYPFFRLRGLVSRKHILFAMNAQLSSHPASLAGKSAKYIILSAPCLVKLSGTEKSGVKPC